MSQRRNSWAATLLADRVPPIAVAISRTYSLTTLLFILVFPKLFMSTRSKRFRSKNVISKIMPNIGNPVPVFGTLYTYLDFWISDKNA
jgi:hypothetical protein